MRKAAIIICILCLSIVAVAQNRPQVKPVAVKSCPRTPMGTRVVVLNPYCGFKCWARRIVTSPALLLRLFFDKRGEVNW